MLGMRALALPIRNGKAWTPVHTPVPIQDFCRWDKGDKNAGKSVHLTPCSKGKVEHISVSFWKTLSQIRLHKMTRPTELPCDPVVVYERSLEPRVLRCAGSVCSSSGSSKMLIRVVDLNALDDQFVFGNKYTQSGASHRSVPCDSLAFSWCLLCPGASSNRRCFLCLPVLAPFYFLMA